MTKSSNSLPSTRQLAQQGDPRAIATLINQSFQQHQVRAEVQAAASRLTVRITGQSVPNPQLAAAVQKGLLSLKLTQFSELVVMGFWADEAAAIYDDTGPEFSDISKLRVARDVFRETLRLYPPVPMMVREASQPEQFRDRDVRKGSQVVLSPWHLHRHERLWDRPDDFDPARFGTENGRAFC